MKIIISLKKFYFPEYRVASAKKIPSFGGMTGFERVKNTHQPDTIFIILDFHFHYFGAETNPILFLRSVIMRVVKAFGSWSL